AFQNCTSLTSVTIPERVTDIGSNAFQGCSGLISIVIPNSVISIGGEAFSGCSSLTSITILENVISIGGRAFYGCSGLSTVTLENNAIVSASRTGSTSMNTIFGDQVQEYVLGNNITDIGKYAFYGCNNLNCIILGNNISNIGYKAFPQTASLYTSIGKTLLTLWSNGYENIKETETSRSLSVPEMSVLAKTASSLTLSFLNPFTELTETVKVSGTPIEKKENGYEIKLTGLSPYETYDFSFTLTSEDATYERTYSFRTEPLTLTTQQPKVISMGNAIVSAESNLDDEETKVGFEWRRTDWTNEFASNTGTAYLYEGKMEGYIRNLYTEKLWKYRPYYESDSGNRYYGEWVGIDPTNTSYFEPTVHTYAQINVIGNKAEVKGYAMRGTDNVVSQGFMYWPGNTSVSLRKKANSVPDNVTVVNASGNVMTATLEDLEYETTYNYVAFVTTSEGETFYGELQTFSTSIDPDGIEEVKASEDAVEIARYDLQGRKIAKPQKGINIIRYSDGTTRKVLVK
ncbi:MAG: leucine-rich repeat domain-containing protein, partial [Bacteroidales bacterium]|nr:leucine-rich repeat domain-containing protein [Bacteroidales bacterium]